MTRRFTSEDLYAIRNDISVRYVIENILNIPAKEVEGIFRFLCPTCGEFQTAINPKTNLSRCFRCLQNFKTIELVMHDQKMSFVDSVKFLQRSLNGNRQGAPHERLQPVLKHSDTLKGLN